VYPPKHHQEYRLDTIKSVAIAYPFATLISAQNKTPFVTHAPLIFDGDTTKQLPTWNYIIAHAMGTVSAIKDPEVIKKSMIRMTDFLETNDTKFKLLIDDPRMDRLTPYIHCFEIKVTTWEGKFKLSQDKTPMDIQNAKQELIKNNQKNISDFVNQLFDVHF